MAHINKCIEDLLRKSGKKAVVNHAAVWVPDNEANICMHCKKTQFTMLVRRVSAFSYLLKIKQITKNIIYSITAEVVELSFVVPVHQRNSYYHNKARKLYVFV